MGLDWGCVNVRVRNEWDDNVNVNVNKNEMCMNIKCIWIYKCESVIGVGLELCVKNEWNDNVNVNMNI